MRAIKLLREANIGLQTLQVILNALDLNDSEINPITLIPDDIANFVISLCYKDVDLFKLIEGYANLKQPSSQSDSKISLDVIGKIDLDEHNNPKGLIAVQFKSSVF